MSRTKIILKTLFIVNALAVCFIGLQSFADSPNKRVLTEKLEVVPSLETAAFLGGGSKVELIDDVQGDDFYFDNDVAEPLVYEEPKIETDTPAEPTLFQEPELLAELKNTSYKFEDSELAVNLLELLDVTERPTELTEMDEHAYFTHYSKYHYGLTAGDNYCEKHREYFTNHPETTFEEVNLYTDLPQKTLIRGKLVPAFANESMPHIGGHMDDDLKKQYVYDLNVNISLYYSDYLFWAREIGKQFSCLTQSSNHVPGHVFIYRKDYAAQAIREYKKQYVGKPECLRTNKFFPESWLLTEKDQCEDFFENFNSYEYEELKRERGPVYIRKIAAGSHAARGVAIVNQTEEDDIRKMYDNGALCGKINKNYLIQKLVHNPLLLQGHKFDFRVFMLIASTNPTIAYFYRQAIVWASTSKYGENVADKASFITNAAFNSTVISTVRNNGTYNGMTFDELRDFATQTLEEVEGRLLKSGQITDSNWLDNYLRPELRRALAHIIRMGQAPFLRTSSIYEIMGVDFMLDDNLDLWFIEANIYPSFIEYSPKESKILNGMLKDHWEIVQGLLKSRAKRIINYINFLTKEGKGWRDENGASFDDFELRQREFKEISKNYFESEFEPSATNGFELVANENLNDEGRYAGLIPTHCF